MSEKRIYPPFLREVKLTLLTVAMYSLMEVFIFSPSTISEINRFYGCKRWDIHADEGDVCVYTLDTIWHNL